MIVSRNVKIRGTAVLAIVVALIGGCEKTPSQPQERAPFLESLVAFPLDSLEPSVRAQITEALALVNSEPANAEAVGRLGMLFHAYQVHAQAQTCYREAVRLSPGDTRWHFYLGSILALNGAYGDAIKHFEEALASKADEPAILCALAEAKLALGEFDAALSYFSRVTTLAPESVRAWYGAGATLYKLGRFEEAEDRLSRALILWPEHGAARYVLAKVLRRLGRGEDAKVAFMAAEWNREKPLPVSDAYEQALDDLAIGAIKALTRGVARLQAGDAEAAIVLLEESLRINPRLAETQMHLGVAYLKLDRLEQARAHLERAVDMQSGFALAHYNLGLIAHRRGAYKIASEHFRAALETQPNHFDALLGLGIARMRLGRSGEAVVSLRSAARIHPTDPRPYKHLATILKNRGAFREAIAVMREAVTHLPEDAAIANRLAWLLATCPNEECRKPAEALTLARRCCAMTENRVPQAMDTLATALAANHLFDEAVRVAGEAMALARARGRDDLVREIESRLEMFRRGRPYIGEPVPAAADD